MLVPAKVACKDAFNGRWNMHFWRSRFVPSSCSLSIHCTGDMTLLRRSADISVDILEHNVLQNKESGILSTISASPDECLRYSAPRLERAFGTGSMAKKVHDGNAIVRFEFQGSSCAPQCRRQTMKQPALGDHDGS
jgi:hypothetical protein